MNHIPHRTPNVRVLNLSDIVWPGGRLLDIDSEDIETIVKKIRQYADMPYVCIVAKDRATQLADLLAALKAIRSPCYPYAVFAIDGVELNVGDTDLDIVEIVSTDPETIHHRVMEYAKVRFHFDEKRLRIDNPAPLPSVVDVAVVGAGITGLYAASQLMEAGISFCVLEKSDRVGGIWSRYANQTSQVNTSESAYRLFEKKTRSNRDHSFTREILEDIAQLSQNVSNHLFPVTAVEGIEKSGSRYRIRLKSGDKSSILESKGIILAINDRVGMPREVEWDNQPVFQGQLVSGISDEAKGVDWRNKNVVIVGMGAFAVENARTALEAGARHVKVVGRRHGTVCPKIIDYLNFATPYDDAFRHDKKSNLRNMTYWKKLYELSGATQPECWMGKIKHDGHTISVSDIWFIGHYLKKIETLTGEITGMTETGVVVDHRDPIDADIVVKCIGFERNAPVARMVSGYPEITNINYVDKDFIYLADAHIDNDAFNSFFGSSVLEMVKFYMAVYILFFDTPAYDILRRTEGVEKIPIEKRTWSDYIKGAMALIRNHPGIHEIAAKQVAQRTRNFLESHDLDTYISENKREWIDTHSLLAGRPMTEAECLPYVFERLLPRKN